MSDRMEEIVIVRRSRHGGDEEHHGGVWKIAFADFMTAMMAFFLVMWLISAKDKLRASLARSFNPVQVVDPTLQPRGLQDVKVDTPSVVVPRQKSGDKRASSGKPTAGSKPNERVNTKTGETMQAREMRLDLAMRENPMATLAEIAGEILPTSTDKIFSRVPVIGRKGGEVTRDPFAPSPLPPNAIPDDEDPIVVATPSLPRPKATVAEERAEKTRKSGNQAELPAIRQQLLESAGKDQGGPGVSLNQTSEGLLVSFTDTEGFSMFANGSAVPNRRLIAMMERLAHILSARKGGVVVRGFTDNKPFRSRRYDNWNLSIDRAQAAHYMLVRGGLGEARIAAIKGYADRSLQKGNDPSSPINRRIEVLLEKEN